MKSNLIRFPVEERRFETTGDVARWLLTNECDIDKIAVAVFYKDHGTEIVNAPQLDAATVLGMLSWASHSLFNWALEHPADDED